MVRKYLLDTNVFIEAYKRYYSFDFGMQFWDFLVDKAKQGLVASIDRVLDELRRTDDPLKQWAEKRFLPFFHSTQGDCVSEFYKKLVNYVQNSKQYKEEAKMEFMEASNADPWLVAFAKCNGYIIVTHEVPSPFAKKKVPLPNLCREFDIEFTDTFSMLKDLGFRF